MGGGDGCARYKLASALVEGSCCTYCTLRCATDCPGIGSLLLPALLAALEDLYLSEYGQTLIAAVRGYLTDHSAGLPISSATLMAMWQVWGSVAFFLAVVGNLGGRIAWALFGFVTAAMVWSVTLPPSQAVAAGVTAFWWSALSVVAYGHERRVARKRQRRTGTGAGSVTADAKERAHRSARRLSYAGLEAYFDDRGHQNLDVIARDLRISPKSASRIRNEFVEDWMPKSATCAPGTQRLIVADARQGIDIGAIAREHGVTPKVVRHLKQRFDVAHSKAPSQQAKVQGRT